MEINGKAIIYSILLLLILFLLLVSTGLIDLKYGKQSQSATSASNEGIPEKCQIPAGEDVESWKEHLGHHAETRGCLKYFN